MFSDGVVCFGTMDVDGFFRWLSRWQHLFEMLLAIAFFYLLIAIEQLRTYDQKRHSLIENRAKVVAGLAIAIIVFKWMVESSASP